VCCPQERLTRGDDIALDKLEEIVDDLMRFNFNSVGAAPDAGARQIERAAYPTAQDRADPLVGRAPA
jgi:hypothetical protein